MNTHPIVALSPDDPVSRSFMIRQIEAYVSPRIQELIDSGNREATHNLWIARVSDYYDVKVVIDDSRALSTDRDFLERARSLSQKIEDELYDQGVTTAIYISVRGRAS